MKCPNPNCNVELKFVYAFSAEENRQELRLSGGFLEWGATEPVDGSCKSLELECPYCAKQLFKNDGNSQDPMIIAVLSGSVKLK
jgi:hypothetical protein